MAKFCSNCGSPVSENDKFCPNCGAVIGAGTERNSPASSEAVTAKYDKDRTLCGILAIILGGFGVHYFYVNKIGGGFICILLTACTCGLWYYVSLVQGIMFLTRSNEEFEDKFANSDKAFPLF